jgi:hypothetical protein
MKFSRETLYAVVACNLHHRADTIGWTGRAYARIARWVTPLPANGRAGGRRLKPSRRFLAASWVTLAWMALTASLTVSFAQDNSVQQSIEESRRMAQQVSRELTAQLLREMQLSGPVRSLLVCKYVCQEILSSQSRKTGWRIAAVSLKPRNSAVGMPDPWEQKVLADFARRAATGEKVEALEFAETVSEPQGIYFRYARAMAVDRLCLACHAARDKLSDAVKAALAAHYPFDRATGFTAGQVYGIISIKRDFDHMEAQRKHESGSGAKGS